MIIFTATGNAHKVRELSGIFPFCTLKTPADAALDFDHEETGSTFFENAYGKALALHKMVKAPVLADDSGLCVDALNGRPGIHSARYGQEEFGRPLSQEEKTEFLLNNLGNVKDRNARFVCSMVLLLDENRFYTVQEILSGTITFKPAGTNGFGYDPVFFLPEYGKTVAELPEDEKNRISHRGLAGAGLYSIMKNLQRSRE